MTISKMIRETYVANLPYVDGFKVCVNVPNCKRLKYDLCIDLNESDLVLKVLAYKSLTVPVYLASEHKDYNNRHVLYERLESIRSSILRLREEENVTRRVSKD